MWSVVRKFRRRHRGCCASEHAFVLLAGSSSSRCHSSSAVRKRLLSVEDMRHVLIVMCLRLRSQLPIANADRRLMTAFVGNNRAALASASPIVAILPVAHSTLIAWLPVLHGTVARAHYHKDDCRVYHASSVHNALYQPLYGYCLVSSSPCPLYAPCGGMHTRASRTLIPQYNTELGRLGDFERYQITVPLWVLVLEQHPPLAGNSGY